MRVKVIAPLALIQAKVPSQSVTTAEVSAGDALGKTIFLMWSILLRLPPGQPLGWGLDFLF
jgi:hypothetical protein